MRKMISIMVTVFFGVILSIFTFNSCTLAEEQMKSEALSVLPEGWIMVKENVWLIFADMPVEYFKKAQEDFLNNNFKEAALKINQGAAIIKIEMSRCLDESKKKLDATVNELEGLTKNIEKGKIMSVGLLSDAFSRAEYALANHHYQKALKYEAQDDYQEMIQSLYAVATHLLYAANWSGEKLDREDTACAMESRSMGKDLMLGISIKKSKASKALKGLGQGIKSLGKRRRSEEPWPSSE